MYHYVLSVFKFGDQLEATECTMKCRGLRYIWQAELTFIRKY